MFQNLPQVTKNILLLNIAFFVASLLLKSQGIGLEMTLGAHYINSPFFEPYQVVTHFFMHSTDNFLHIFFNMWLFVMLGAYLENIWGPKRFFIFYLVSAMGSFALYNMIGFIEIMNLKRSLAAQFDIDQFNYFLKHTVDLNGNLIGQINSYISENQISVTPSLQSYSSDNVAHLAHVGGALAGAILVLVWRKKDRSNFW